jgi:hypothetical protein
MLDHVKRGTPHAYRRLDIGRTSVRRILAAQPQKK